MEVVISRFNENLDWIHNFNKDIKISIFNKGRDINLHHIKLENLGRESDTFLRFIVNEYPNFNEYTAFLQGNPFEHIHDVVNIINRHSNDKIVYLSNKILIDENNGCPHHCGLSIESTASQLGVYSEKYTFAAGAQYIVHKDLILSKPIGWWKSALKLHNTPTENYRGNPNMAPWIFERLWINIWNLKV